LISSTLDLDLPLQPDYGGTFMITEWQIQTLSRKCAISDKVFEPGDDVSCLLVDTIGEGLVRLDVLDSCVNELPHEGQIVGRWKRTVKPVDDSAAEGKRQQAQSVEELFLSMAESVPVEIRSNSTRCMIYILALFLERRKILKNIEMRGIPQNYLCFRHTKTKQEYLIEQVAMNPENMAHIENNLSILGGGPGASDDSQTP
jgi:hypothetical protein